MNKILNAEKTWAIFFREKVETGFDFGKDLLQIVKGYPDKHLLIFKLMRLFFSGFEPENSVKTSWALTIMELC
jgi:hypothetical protein